MVRHILVGLNGSEEANRALAEALWLAAASGGEVWALSVEERLPAYAASVGEVEEAQAKGRPIFSRSRQPRSSRRRRLASSCIRSPSPDTPSKPLCVMRRRVDST